MTPPFSQGHLTAAVNIGDCYYWGKGVAIDDQRAMAAFKFAADGGNCDGQYQVGMMYYQGRGVAQDYNAAWPWMVKAAAQDLPGAVASVAGFYISGLAGNASWRRARQYIEKAISLGHPPSRGYRRAFATQIQQVAKWASRPICNFCP